MYPSFSVGTNGSVSHLAVSAPTTSMCPMISTGRFDADQAFEMLARDALPDGAIVARRRGCGYGIRRLRARGGRRERDEAGEEQDVSRHVSRVARLCVADEYTPRRTWCHPCARPSA